MSWIECFPIRSLSFLQKVSFLLLITKLVTHESTNGSKITQVLLGLMRVCPKKMANRRYRWIDFIFPPISKLENPSRFEANSKISKYPIACYIYIYIYIPSSHFHKKYQHMLLAWNTRLYSPIILSVVHSSRSAIGNFHLGLCNSPCYITILGKWIPRKTSIFDG